MLLVRSTSMASAMRSATPATASALRCGEGSRKADVAVFGQAAEELEALRRQRLVGDQLIACRQHHANTAQQAAFVIGQLEPAVSV